MLFRFACALSIVVLISLIGAAIENRMLELKRERTRQDYRSDVLAEEERRLQLEAQELGAPARIWKRVGGDESGPRSANREESTRIASRPTITRGSRSRTADAPLPPPKSTGNGSSVVPTTRHRSPAVRRQQGSNPPTLSGRRSGGARGR